MQESLEEEVQIIFNEWKKRELSGILAIDGMCGSGKTTLSALLADKIGYPVIHMDDYYLPFVKRKKNWRKIPAGNMDIFRFYTEVIAAFERGESIQTERYLCRENQYIKENIPKSDGLIIEGTYSCHPYLRSSYRLRIFLEIPDDIQQKRIIAREGDHSRDFLALSLFLCDDSF